MILCCFGGHHRKGGLVSAVLLKSLQRNSNWSLLAAALLTMLSLLLSPCLLSLLPSEHCSPSVFFLVPSSLTIASVCFAFENCLFIYFCLFLMMNVVGNEDFFLLAMRISYWVCIAITWVFFGLFIRFSGFTGGLPNNRSWKLMSQLSC